MSERLIIAPLTTQERKKVTSDLTFISQLTQNGRDLGYRVIVGGGYAVDGALGRITRPHGDIDMQIYGQENNGEKVLQEMLQPINPTLSHQLQKKEATEFYTIFQLSTPTSFTELYYLQTDKDPFEDTKVIIKSDGTYTAPHLYRSQLATLEGYAFEIQDPLIEVLDKMYKRELRGDPKKEKHLQDLENLRTIIPHETITHSWETIKKNGRMSY